MNMQAMTVLMPDFYKDFHCTAAECRNNCCVFPWRIFINKANYKAVRGLREPKWLSESFGSYIQRNRKSTDDSSYAEVVYNAHGCAFQDENGLCRLQSDAGAQYLSHTCRIYPRQENYIVSTAAAVQQKLAPANPIATTTVTVQQELSLTTSCEEVSRILFHHPEPIAFLSEKSEINMANFNSEHKAVSNYLVYDDTHPMLEHYNLVRAVGIGILQNRDYSVEQRLILLTLYLDKLSQAERDGTVSDIPAMTDLFVKAVDTRLYDQLFTAKKATHIVALLTNYASVYAFAPHAGSPTVQRCNHGITDVDFALRTQNYHEFFRDKEYFLEHLLVSEFFGKALPFKMNRSISDCSQYLVSIYTIFRFMFSAYLGEHSDLSETEFVDFSAFFGKSVLHSSGSFDVNIKLLAKNDMGTLPYMVAIILE